MSNTSKGFIIALAVLVGVVVGLATPSLWLLGVAATISLIVIAFAIDASINKI